MAIVSPLGEESIFYIPETIDSSPVTTAYKHYIEERTSGLDVLEAYKSATVEANEIIIFFETNIVKDTYGKPQKQTNNLFGTVCLVKIGSDYLKNIINKANVGYEVSILNQGVVKKTVRSLNEYCETLHEIYPTKILDSKSLYNAIQMEVRAPNSLERILSDIYKSNSDFSDWIGMGIDKLENWKLTEENYDFEKHYLMPSLNKKRGVEPQQITYRPIIPVPIKIEGKDQLISNLNAYAEIKHLVDTFTETILGAVDDLVKTTPNQVDDKAWAFVKELFIKLNDTISGFLGPIYEKLKELLAGVFKFIEQLIKLVGDLLTEGLALINAIACGIVNGLISIIQTILSIVELVSKATPLNLAAQMLPENLARHQETMELIEDTIDMLTENASAIFSGLVDTLTDKETWKQLSAFISSLWRKFTDQTNEYFWAYIVGAIVFEVIVEILLAVATSGGSAVASISGRISRATTKAQALFRKGAQAAKTAGKVIGKAAIDILQWLRKEIAELIEALKNRKFLEWVRGKIITLFGNPVDDIPSLSKAEMDWMGVSKILDNLGGKVMNARQLKKLRGILQKKNIILFLEDDVAAIKQLFKPMVANGITFDNVDDLFRYMRNEGFVGGFDGATMQMVLPRKYNPVIGEFQNPSQLVAFHELAHVRQFEEIGASAYLELPKWQREQYVWNQIWENKKKWTSAELESCLDYINGVRRHAKIDPLKIKL